MLNYQRVSIIWVGVLSWSSWAFYQSQWMASHRFVCPSEWGFGSDQKKCHLNGKIWGSKRFQIWGYPNWQIHLMVHYRGCFFGPIPSIPRKFACHWFKSSNFYPSEKFMINIPLSNSSMGLYPLVIQHSYGKSPLLMGKSTISTGPFSIAMLNYQRVTKGLSI